MVTAAYDPTKRTTGSTETGSSAGSQTRTQMQDAAHGAVERVEQAAQAVAEQAGHAAQNVREVTDTFANAIEESLDKRPMTTLGMAVALGFFLGAIWQR